LAAVVSGPVHRVVLERSAHVATLDHDRDTLGRAVVAFADAVTAC
jgi:esterase/lipase